MRTLARFFLFWLLLALGSSSFAMQCRPLEPDRIAAEAEVVFVGKVVSITPAEHGSGMCWKAAQGSECGGKIAVFEVARSLKGKTSGKVSVVAEDGCYCLGSYFTVGREYLVVAGKNTTPLKADVLAKNVCWGTGPSAGALQKKVIERLSAGDQ